MALDAIVSGSLRHARGQGLATRMASETALAVILQSLSRLGQGVRVMARNTAELALARAKTATAVNLLGVTPGVLAVGEIIGPDKDRQKQVQGQPRTIIEE